MIPSKSICIPAVPPVDVGEYLRIIDHPHFQRLRERKQLGVNYLVFPGAVHTRFEHALGSLALTQRFCRIHAIAGEEKHLLCAFALLHDIGHGPFSHQVEPVIGGSHHDHGICCLDEMAPALRSIGLQTDVLAGMFAPETPQSALVSDRNLGTDKLDYLVRDALHIGFAGCPDVERLQFYTSWNGTRLAVEEKYIEDIKRVQKFYSYLHQHGYLNKSALAAQRMLQRSIQERLRESGDAPGALWDMTDATLMQWLAGSRDPVATGLTKRLERRDLHRSLVVIKPERYGFVERQSGKPLEVIEWPRRKLLQFSQVFGECTRLSVLEDALCESCGVPRGTLLFAAMPYFRKLLPRDVMIFSQRLGDFSLFEKDRDHFRSLEGDYLRTFAVRVIVASECRDALAGQAADIAAFLERQVLPEGQ